MLEVNQTWNGGTISAKEQYCASSGILRNSAFIFLSLKCTRQFSFTSKKYNLQFSKITLCRKYQYLPLRQI